MIIAVWCPNDSDDEIKKLNYVLAFSIGLLMSIDIIEERGLSQADYKWGDPDECRFPLFHFMRVPPIEWIYMIYLVMLLGKFVWAVKVPIYLLSNL